MRKKIVMAAGECDPYVKTGGLGDVIGGLSRALANAGHEVTVFLPYYKGIKEKYKPMAESKVEIEVMMGENKTRGNFYNIKANKNLKVVCLENHELYYRDELYFDSKKSSDFPDNDLRFGFFSQAIIEYLKKVKYRPHIIHAHDWQAGLLPALVHLDNDPFFKKTATIFTIHNLAFQGLFEKEKLPLFGLPNESYNENGVHFFDKISLLKGGIAFSDLVTTVSRKYAVEIRSKEFGFGMETILKSRESDLFGIVNGMDYSVWNPVTDKNIPQNFSPDDLAGKGVCKEEIIAQFNLSAKAKKGPVFGMVSRLTQQKGLDLVVDVAPDIFAHGGHLVILGQGDKKIINSLLDIEKRFPGKIGVRTVFDDVLAHKIVAGSDFFLMPSRFEPCGLTQMYSLKYATPPIVRAVGGLDDTVSEFFPKSGRGNGFKFAEDLAESLLKSIAKSFDIFQNDKWLEKIRKNAMAKDYSWTKQVRKYVRVYNLALRRNGLPSQ